MNRRRSKSRANFPRNLYESKGYYSWRHPETGETFGLGRDRARAFEEALEANLKLAKPRERLIDRISSNGQSVAAWEAKYQGIVKARGLTKGTLSNYLAFSRHVVRMLGEKPMRAVTAKEIADGLDEHAVEMPRNAQSLRAYMRQSFAAAVNAGWLDTSPVRDHIIQGDKSAKRARLTLDVFMKVYETAPTEWLRNAMALALVSAQRREDVATAQFKDFKEGGWWLTQHSKKTDHPHRIFIPLELRPVGFPLRLADVIRQCRLSGDGKLSGTASAFCIHQSTQRGPSKIGDRLRLSTITRGFTEAVKALGTDWGIKTPPTFHEIRSLSLRLYGDQGVNVQLLAGHSDPDTTAIYLNSRGQEYARVTV